MTEPVRRLLAVGFPATELATYRPVLEVGATALDVTAGGADAESRVRSEPYNCVILRHPSRTADVESVIAAMRAAGGVNVSVGAVVVASPERLVDAEGLKERGVNKVVSSADSPELLGVVVMRLESVNSRHAERIPVRLPMSCTFGDQKLRGLTVNVSMRGVLFETRGETRRGATFSYRLHLPGQDVPVGGDGKVVRIALLEKEGVEGFAARFVTFGGDGKARLEAFLDSLRRPGHSI